MRTKKSRIALSAVSILLVISLLAGGTMAWFTDTEKVNANFMAGVLDISVRPGEETDPQVASLEFENLRPMLYNKFYAELDEKPNPKGKWDNNVGANGMQDTDYNPVPAYFKPVVVKNDGTLPAYLRFTVEVNKDAIEKCEGEVHTGVTSSHSNTIKQDEEHPTDPCTNGLQDILEIYVYYKNADNKWTRVMVDEEKKIPLNLNPATGGENPQYNPNVILGAGKEVTYVVAGYLPPEAGNIYQGKHFHSNLVVNAFQTDGGSGATPGDQGGSSSDPSPSGKVEHTVHITFKDAMDTTAVITDTNYTFQTEKNATYYDLTEAELQALLDSLGYKSYDVTGVDTATNAQTRSTKDDGVILRIAIENNQVTERYQEIVAFAKKMEEPGQTKDVEIGITVVDQDNPTGLVLHYGTFTAAVDKDATEVLFADYEKAMMAEIARLQTTTYPQYEYVSASPDRLNIVEQGGKLVAEKSLTIVMKSNALTNVTYATVHYNVVDEAGNPAKDDAGNPIVLQNGQYQLVVDGLFNYSTASIPAPDGYDKVSVTPDIITVTYANRVWTASDVTMTVKKANEYIATADIYARVGTGGGPQDYEDVPARLYLTQAVVDKVKAGNGKLVKVMISELRITGFDGQGNETDTLELPNGYIVRSDGSVRLAWENEAVVSKTGLPVVQMSTAAYRRTARAASTSQELYEIATEEELKAVKDHMNAYVLLLADITLSDSSWQPIGWGTSSDVPFTGTFDGGYYSINNLTADYGSNDTNVGLIAINGGTIKNLTVSASEYNPQTNFGGVYGGRNVGIVTGANNAGATIDNVHVYGNVGALNMSDSAGGSIAGQNSGTIIRCNANTGVEGYAWVGGITGKNFGVISQSWFVGGINSDISGDQAYQNDIKYIGGIAGGNQYGTIQDSYVILNNYIKGYKGVGGMVGWIKGGNLQNVFAAGTKYVYGSYYANKDIGYAVELPTYANLYTPNDAGWSSLPQGFSDTVWNMEASTDRQYPNLINNGR